MRDAGSVGLVAVLIHNYLHVYQEPHPQRCCSLDCKTTKYSNGIYKTCEHWIQKLLTPSIGPVHVILHKDVNKMLQYCEVGIRSMRKTLDKVTTSKSAKG